MAFSRWAGVVVMVVVVGVTVTVVSNATVTATAAATTRALSAQTAVTASVAVTITATRRGAGWLVGVGVVGATTRGGRGSAVAPRGRRILWAPLVCLLGPAQSSHVEQTSSEACRRAGDARTAAMAHWHWAGKWRRQQKQHKVHTAARGCGVLRVTVDRAPSPQRTRRDGRATTA